MTGSSFNKNDSCNLSLKSSSPDKLGKQNVNEGEKNKLFRKMHFLFKKKG